MLLSRGIIAHSKFGIQYRALKISSEDGVVTHLRHGYSEELDYKFNIKNDEYVPVDAVSIEFNWDGINTEDAVILSNIPCDPDVIKIMQVMPMTIQGIGTHRRLIKYFGEDPSIGRTMIAHRHDVWDRAEIGMEEWNIF